MSLNSEWWFKRPTLILIKNPQVVGALDSETVDELTKLVGAFYRELAAQFTTQGCPTVFWDGEPLAETPSRAVIINPVFLALPQAAQAIWELEDFRQFRAGLKEHLPEIFPLVVSVGRNQLHLNPPLHPNFANLICLDDTAGHCRNLGDDRTVILMRTLMAKLGAFKNIVVLYDRGADGRLAFRGMILGTLEGGHPRIESVPDLARRLMVFGSAAEVGGWAIYKGATIREEAWQKSSVVKGLIELGRFLGGRGLLSDPVNIRDLVKKPKLADLIVRLVNYSRQAEGAFMAFEPELPYRPGEAPNLPGLPWTGVSIVTCSGRFGAIKTDLSYSDLDAIVPSEQRDQVAVIPVEGIEPKGPSVEAEEFIFPQVELAEQLKLALSRVEGGYRRDEQGNIVVPPIRGVVHLHRGFRSPVSGKVLVVPSDIARFPPVGCGVDLMHEMSRDAMKRALDLWLENGQEAICALFYVPNHGTNVFVFWASDNTGLVPEDPFALFKALISSGELAFTPDVPQV